MLKMQSVGLTIPLLAMRGANSQSSGPRYIFLLFLILMNDLFFFFLSDSYKFLLAFRVSVGSLVMEGQPRIGGLLRHSSSSTLTLCAQKSVILRNTLIRMVKFSTSALGVTLHLFNLLLRKMQPRPLTLPKTGML